ncbi:hemolymph juvenile hormone-binding protein [Oryctes borbonicus]|uniref:Hemolymph juvenile hormone-binding protein n=1 Tax=Oryctes borbonicus TaxID=1629725 RepID=A0A0T6B9A2_9SCAR|nr:hemolymph juvenile hormone-binding protein [Oryctes borbonicus]
MFFLAIVGVLFVKTVGEETSENIPPYIKQCKEGDPNIIRCLIDAVHHLSPYLASGIPEIELPPVEPFRMEELSLSLTTGPNGYKVTLSDIDIFGASNFTINKLKMSENGKPFEAEIYMPELRINSKYSSSGVLIILPASGKGSFHGRFGSVTATVRGKTSTHIRKEKKYLHVDTLSFDMKVKTINMGVKNVYKNSRILVEAMNLFLRENGQEVLHVMTPQLRNKLSSLFMNISNQLLTHVPQDVFYVPKHSNVTSTV